MSFLLIGTRCDNPEILQLLHRAQVVQSRCAPLWMPTRSGSGRV